MIDNSQWYTICNNLLGLRSEDNPTTINNTGASYAMDMGKDYTWGDSAPANWGQLLEGTIRTMQSFKGYEGRHLMIVSKSSGNTTDSEYAGCFPKCSSNATTVHAVTSLNDTVENLTVWVENTIKKFH